MMFLLHTAGIRIKSPQPIKMCLINVYFHFLLNALYAHGCHLETLSICVFQHLNFVYLCITCLVKILPQQFQFASFLKTSQPQLSLSCIRATHILFHLRLSCHSEKTVPAVWCLTKISWKSKLILLREGRLHFLRCLLQGHVSVKRKNGLWSLALVIIYLVHTSLPNYTANIQGGRAFTSAYFQQFKLSIYCLC